MAVRAYGTAFRETAGAAGRLMEGVVSVVTLGVAVITGWRYGVAWGVSLILGVLLAVAVATGVRIQSRLDGATLGPPLSWTS